MSDTDDTDYLLLIPPDFFVVNLSECNSPTFDANLEKDSGIGIAVNFLANRVEDLYDRVSFMETISPGRFDDLNDTSFSVSYAKELTHNCNAIDKKATDELNNIWPMKLEDFQSTLNNRLKNTESQFKTSTPNLATKNFQKSSAGRKPLNDTSCSQNDNLASSKFNLYQVDKLLCEMEKTRNEIKSKLQSNKKQISMMKRNFSKSNNDAERKFVLQNEANCKYENHLRNDKDSTTSTGSISSQTRINELLSLPRQTKSMLSISKVMSDTNNLETLQQKLEAEILKRKHCEELIQQLQLNVLEQEQNLTVALRVDAEKEEFIEQLQAGWTQLVDHWKELENQRQELASMLEHERNEARDAINSSSQKIQDLENRLQEGYALLAEYEEKNKNLENSFRDLKQSLDNITAEFDFKVTSVQQNVDRLEKDKICLTEQLDHVKENLANEKQKSLELESRVSDLEKLSSSLNREKQDLAQKYEEEKRITDSLKTEIVKLNLNHSLATSAEATATKELNKLKQEMVKIKNSLREYYQKQLDNVLKEKVDEFQRQIQNAEKIMHQELHKQEKLTNEKFRAEIIKLQNTHKFELSEERRINLKHVNILKSELKESRKKIQQLEDKHRSDPSAMKRVQTVDDQWLETLSSLAGDYSKDPRSSNLNEKYLLTEDTSCNEENLSELDKTTVDLRRYVEMLLEKHPGKPIEASSTKNFDDVVKHKKPPWK